jgi:SAM-dependent methyltransferase
MKTPGNPTGFLVGGDPLDLFKGAAPYYAAFRRPYPAPVAEYIVNRCGLDRTGRLLDAGCGTGQVFQVFAPWFHVVVAIDRDPEMIRHAIKTAERLDLSNVECRQTAVEDLSADIAPLRMTIFGASFHWVDRVAIANAIYDLTEPGGYLAVLAPGDIPRGDTDWEQLIRGLLLKHLGPVRKAGSGIFCEGERHEDALRRTRFANVEQIDIPVVETWTIDQIVGHLFSHSFATKPILGDRAAPLERDLRQALANLRPDNSFTKTNSFTVITCRKNPL